MMDKTASSRNVVIGVAAHKPYRMPADGAYLPIHVGACLLYTSDAADE